MISKIELLQSSMNLEEFRTAVAKAPICLHCKAILGSYSPLAPVGLSFLNLAVLETI